MSELSAMILELTRSGADKITFIAGERPVMSIGGRNGALPRAAAVTPRRVNAAASELLSREEIEALPSKRPRIVRHEHDGEVFVFELSKKGPRLTISVRAAGGDVRAEAVRPAEGARPPRAAAKSDARADAAHRTKRHDSMPPPSRRETVPPKQDDSTPPRSRRESAPPSRQQDSAPPSRRLTARPSAPAPRKSLSPKRASLAPGASGKQSGKQRGNSLTPAPTSESAAVRKALQAASSYRVSVSDLGELDELGDVGDPAAGSEASFEQAPLEQPSFEQAPLEVVAPISAPMSRAVREPSSANAALGSLLAAARDAGASDLHLVAERPMLLRQYGELVPHGQPLAPSKVEEMLLASVPPRLRDTLDREGSCDFALDHPVHGRFRVNVSRQRTGYKGSFRLIPYEVPTLASLGLPEAIANATHHHQGLIVVTGPTGHGKTTTLAAIVDVINRDTTHHIISVEDPVEFVHPRKRAMMSQREVGTHTKSFASALKGSLREDPDVIIVGELRDTETVRMALSAGETGHLVVGTMNTPSAAKTIERLIDLFPPSDQPQVRMTLAGALRLVVSQRLIPAADGQSLVAAAELLPGSVPLSNLIRDARTYQIPSLQQRGRAFGIIRIDDSLAELALAKKITHEVALANAESAQELEALLRPPAPAQAAGPQAVATGQAAPKPQAQAAQAQAAQAQAAQAQAAQAQAQAGPTAAEKAAEAAERAAEKAGTLLQRAGSFFIKK